MNAYETRLLTNVEHHGWHATAVPGSPSFLYSVGFTKTLRCPELIVFGLPVALMHSMVSDAYRQLKRGQQLLRDGRRWSGLLDGFDCITRAVAPRQLVPRWFNSALWFRERQDPPGRLAAFQLVWPDRDTGLFPWQKGCPQSVRDAQPALFRSRR